MHGFMYVEFRGTPKHVQEAKEFYRQLFTWQMDTIARGPNPYHAFDVENGVGGGITTATQDETSRWIPYVRVRSLDDKTREAVALGAAIIYGPVTIPFKGRLCILADPCHVAFGIWEPFQPEGL